MPNYSIVGKDFIAGGPCDVRSQGGGNRDLTLIKQSYKKTRYVVLTNRVTGKVCIVDQVKARYDRLRNRIHNWATIISTIPGKKRMVMIGLTYREGEPWQPNDIRDFMITVKRKLGESLLAYAWVSELQTRGALHYHVVLYMRTTARLPLPDKAGWWKHGSTKVTGARSPFYLVSYTKKQDQKDYMKFPEGARAFAVWINEKTLSEQLRKLSLKEVEKRVVEVYGWDGLAIWRNTKVENPWQCSGFYAELDAAERRTAFILDEFEIYKMCGVSPSMKLKIT